MMFAKQIIRVTRNYLSMRQQPAIVVNKHELLCTLKTDTLTRFYSSDSRDEQSSPSLKAGVDEDRKMNLIKLELQSLSDEGRDVPTLSYIKPQHWTALLKLNSRNARQKYYHFLWTNEKKNEADKEKKKQKALVYAAFKEQQANDKDKAPPKGRLLLRIYPSTVNNFRKQRLMRAAQFGEKLIYDCSYDQYMTRKEANSAAKQLMYTFCENRRHVEPFDLHFCNVNFNGPTFERLTSYIPTLRDETFPLHLHEGSYLDVFPKEKLVYLTPHCKADLTDYDANAIYIIGAMVDSSNHEPLSMMKSKELGIKMAKLPLERYLDWGQGDKTLTLDQMMKIMLEWRASNSWDKALQHIPRRKVMNRDVDRTKRFEKWTAPANKFKTNFVAKNESFDWDSTGDDRVNDGSGLSTAEKFKRKIRMNNQSNEFETSTRPNYDSRQTDRRRAEFKWKSGTNNQLPNNFEESSYGRTDGTTDKVMKPNRHINKKKLLEDERDH